MYPSRVGRGLGEHGSRVALDAGPRGSGGFFVDRGAVACSHGRVIEYVVQAGDCLSSIASRFGYSDYRVIYDHPSNQGFRELRPDPNLIYPGDVLQIPDPQPGSYRVETGKAYTFVASRPRVTLTLALEVEEPTEYELKCGDETFRGSVSDQSPFSHPVPVDCTHAELTAWTSDEDGHPVGGTTWVLRVGHLDPIEEQSGVLGRLMNLGYYGGELQQPDPSAIRGALRHFQAVSGLEQTGQLDDQTRKALAQRHDGV